MKLHRKVLKAFARQKMISISALLAGIIFALTSCVKDAKLSSPEEGTVYMPAAYQDKADLSLFRLDTPQLVYFGAAYGGFKSAPNDITANFKIDNSLIAQYNSDNAYLGVTYFPLPDTSYTISSLSSVLKAGTTSSDPIELAITTSKLSLGTHYLLPIRMTDISSGKFDSSLSIAYFKIDTLTIRSRDITNHTVSGQSTVYSYNYNDADTYGDSPEDAAHLVDSDYTTKYLEFFFHPDMYTQIQYPSPTVVNAYALTSGGDAPERDPTDWNFAGSNDGKNWTIIQSKTGFQFSGRLQTVQFNTDNNTAYTYYRLNITAVNNPGAATNPPGVYDNQTLFQCTEWRLLQFY